MSLLPFTVVAGASFFAPLFAVLILAVSCSNNALTVLLKKSVFIFLGEISYTLYIIQFPVQALCVILFASYLDVNSTLFFLAYLLVLVMLSAVIHCVFEMPCKKYLLRWYRKSRNKIEYLPGIVVSQ